MRESSVELECCGASRGFKERLRLASNLDCIPRESCAKATRHGMGGDMDVPSNGTIEKQR